MLLVELELELDNQRAAIAAAAEIAGVVLLVDDLAVEVVAGGELKLGALPFYARPAAARADRAAAANGRRWLASVEMRNPAAAVET
jgi:hypothetical protein